MYKVLLVDDERIILDGISSIVKWSEACTTLIGTARNGLEAYEIIFQEQPDIVITDIRMPGMDGIQLVSEVSGHFPKIKFIMLSGFGEFDYAREAMKYGIKHYLVKPCNESKIMEALHEVVAELKLTDEQDQFVQNMRDRIEKVLPHVKEQFLKEFVTNKTYGVHDWAYYRKLFNIDFHIRTVRLILFQVEGDFEFEHLFAVKNIAGDVLSKTLLSATVGDHVIVVVEDREHTEDFHEQMLKIRDTFLGYYKHDLTIALSEPGDITAARSLYRQTLECLNHRFYLGEGSLITKRDLSVMEQLDRCDDPFEYDEENLLLYIKSGKWEAAAEEIEAFFNQAVQLRQDIQTMKSYVIQLFMSLIRLGHSDGFNAYRDQFITLTEMDTLQGMKSFVKEMAYSIAMRYYEQNKNKHSAIVAKMIQHVEDEIANPQLSLGWVAGQLLYMNSDYLGKLFKKETGEKFSNYVIKVRIEKAKQLLETERDIKIFELADRLGFGDNPQYFSQVFKKYSGYAPSEYLK